MEVGKYVVTDHPVSKPTHGYAAKIYPFGFRLPIHCASMHLKPLTPDKSGDMQQCRIACQHTCKVRHIGVVAPHTRTMMVPNASKIYINCEVPCIGLQMGQFSHAHITNATILKTNKLPLEKKGNFKKSSYSDDLSVPQ